jgi:hypothetical protein
MTLRWKILITVLLAVIFVWVFGCASQIEHDRIPDDYKPTTGKLWAEYRAINELAFDGGLPEKETSIELTELDGDMGDVIMPTDGGPYYIHIDRKRHPLEKEAEITLIHEVCHQYDQIHKISEGLDSHGVGFQNCMLHVAQRGGFNDLW